MDRDPHHEGDFERNCLVSTVENIEVELVFVRGLDVSTSSVIALLASVVAAGIIRASS
jgi:hypothetical protein